MRENFPDPFLAQTGFDAETADDLEDEFDFGFDPTRDELEIERERARER